MPTKSAELLHAVSPGILHPNHAGFIAGGGTQTRGISANRRTPAQGSISRTFVLYAFQGRRRLTVC